MCRLHGLLNDFQQLLTQLVQVHLIAQGRTEGCKGTSGIIPGAVEPPVDNGLKTSSQWLEQSSNAKRIRIYRQSKRHFLVVPFPSMYRTIFVSHDGDELPGMSDVRMVQIFLCILCWLLGISVPINVLL